MYEFLYRSLKEERYKKTKYVYITEDGGDFLDKKKRVKNINEYKKRKKTLIDYTNEIDVKLIIENEYGLREFIDNIYPNFDNRCGVCYNMRLFETAKYAKENGFDAFTTTLLISPYQDHDLMCMIAKAAGKKYDIEFLYRDFRLYFNEGQEKAIALNLYRQNYCGCIFSEEERFSKKRRKEIINKQKEKELQ